jgi:hypothetical protein
LIPKDFSVNKAATAKLADLHARLDTAIEDGRTEIEFDLPQQSAKDYRCAIKTELGKRAVKHDSAANAYLEARKKRKSKPSLRAIAAE